MKGIGYRELVEVRRLATLLCLLTALVFNPLAVTAQKPGGVTRRRPPEPVVSPKKTDLSTSTMTDERRQQRVQLVQSRKSQAMSQAFTSGKLPDPMRLPAGNVDTQAAALAKSVSAGDASSTAALHAAVLAAGFGVRDADGSVMQTTERGQGLAFDAWEIASASKLYGEGYGLTLKHLGEAFSLGSPELNDPPLAAALLGGIRNGAESQHPAVRFLARFIIELGRNAEPPYDMLQQNDTAKIRLDAVQTFFILKRLAGDLAAVDQRPESAVSETGFLRNAIGGPLEIRHVALIGADSADGDVSFVPRRTDLVLPLATKRAGTQSPCSTGEWGNVILDYNALASTTLFGTLANRIKGRLGKYGKATNVINMVLTVIKFVATYALLKAEIAIDNHPLVRTKTTTAGEKRVLTAKLGMATDKWELVNCLRPALNYHGLDFDLPSSGPIADAGVEWNLIVGGDTRGWIGTMLDYAEITSGNAPMGDAIVFFEPIPGTDRSPAKQRTGSDGISRMGIVGVPQAKDLSREKLDKVYKAAGVKVGIQIKTMKITDKAKLAETLGDMAGSVISFLTGDYLGTVAGTAAETFYRSHWFSSQPFYFVVTDWEPCTGQWKGTMTASSTYEQHDVEKINAVVKKDDHSSWFVATITFEGGRVSGVVDYEESISTDQREEPDWVLINQQKTTGHYSGDVDASASVSSFGRYDVGFVIPVMKGTYQSSGTCKRPAPLRCDQPESINKRTEVHVTRPSSITGYVDPNKPNEINATKSFGQPGGFQHKITVNLKRCQ
ncbi:MAG TPA: hypothetical protein VFZ23_03610 [Pyrinomonadaceae bacterium]